MLPALSDGAGASPAAAEPSGCASSDCFYFVGEVGAGMWPALSDGAGASPAAVGPGGCASSGSGEAAGWSAPLGGERSSSTPAATVSGGSAPPAALPGGAAEKLSCWRETSPTQAAAVSVGGTLSAALAGGAAEAPSSHRKLCLHRLSRDSMSCNFCFVGGEGDVAADAIGQFVRNLCQVRAHPRGGWGEPTRVTKI